MLHMQETSVFLVKRLFQQFNMKITIFFLLSLIIVILITAEFMPVRGDPIP